MIQNKYHNTRKEKDSSHHKSIKSWPDFELTPGCGSVFDGALDKNEWMRMIKAGKANRANWREQCGLPNRARKGMNMCGEQIRNLTVGCSHRVKTCQCYRNLFSPSLPWSKTGSHSVGQADLNSQPSNLSLPMLGLQALVINTGPDSVFNTENNKEPEHILSRKAAWFT